MGSLCTCDLKMQNVQRHPEDCLWIFWSTIYSTSRHRAQKRKKKVKRKLEEARKHFKMRWKCCLIRLPFSLFQASRKTWQPLPGRFQKRGTRSRIAHCFTQAHLAIVFPVFSQPLHWGGRFSQSTDTIPNNLEESLSEELFWIRAVCGQVCEQCS